MRDKQRAIVPMPSRSIGVLLDASGQPIRPYVAEDAGIRYDPDAQAYRREIGDPEIHGDVSPSPFVQFREAVKRGEAELEVFFLNDGSRRGVGISGAKLREYASVYLDPARRHAYEVATLREQVVAIANAALPKLREANGNLDALHPNEEAALRESGAVVEQDGKAKLREDLVYSDTVIDPGTGNLSNNTWFPEYLPYGQGPFGQQQYLGDQWDSLAKSFYACTHDPLAKQGVNIILYFVMGRGVEVVSKDETGVVQKVIDEFWAREQMDERLKTIVHDLSRDGEQFIRKIPLGEGRLKIRTLDPVTIWEIVTKAEDIEAVDYYRQNYYTRTQLFSPSDGSPAQKWIVRDLSPDEVIHVKINAGAHEVRGRGDIFPVLGYLKRLRDYLTAEVLKADAAARIQYDYTIYGGPSDVTRISGNIQPPTMATTGNAFFHNDAVEVKVLQADKIQPSGQGSIYEAVVNMIAVGFGIAKDYFGITSRGSRATALVATEPATKRFEERQQVVRALVSRIIQSVIDEAVKAGKLSESLDLEFRCDFPSIVSSDKDLMVKLLAIGEAMGWWSKRAAAEKAATEVGLDEYEYEEQAAEVKADMANGSLIWKQYEQVRKGMPLPSDPVLPPGETPNPAASPQPQGARTDQNPAGVAGSNDIRKDLGPHTEALAERGIVIIP